jgi:hypothetical protein
MLGSVLGYFFSLITVFASVMTFMALLIGVFDSSTFEKLRRYPRPIIERTNIAFATAVPGSGSRQSRKKFFAVFPT